MKRNSLTTAVIAGIAGVAGIAGLANAVELNPDGLGQVLVFPYYTVNGGKQTLVSVVNTTDVAKAVKVRFLEGYNSREVLDFNLFLSPYDVWTAATFALGDAGLSGDAAGVTTSDFSCTAPNFSTLATKLADGRPYTPFVNYAFTGSNEDTGPTGLARTREGHLEMIQMADLQGALATAVTHTSSGKPANCGAVQTISLTNTNLLPPTGGLFGAGSIVNAAQGTFYAYNADAIDGFVDHQIYSGTSSTSPSLADAETDQALGQAVAHVFLPGGKLVTSTYDTGLGQGIDAVSAVFTADSIYNEYNVDANAGSNSDWVVTFPTKRFYVDPALNTAAIAPFEELFGENYDGKSCVVVDVGDMYDREEGTPSAPAEGFSPPPPGAPPSSLCYEAQIISFLSVADATANPTSRVLSSNLVTNLVPFAKAGWMRLGLSGNGHSLRPSIEQNVFNGLPVTGFLAVNYVNGNLGAGVLANYSGLYRHRASRSCTTGPCS